VDLILLTLVCSGSDGGGGGGSSNINCSSSSSSIVVVVVVVVVFVSLGTCITVRLGVWPDVFFYECLAAMFVYYAAHWQTYCSGTHHFSTLVSVSLDKTHWL